MADRDTYTVNPVERPRHGDVWQRTWVGRGRSRHGQRFSVMHVCGHHDPPHVTGYWHDYRNAPWPLRSVPDPDDHDAIPLPIFLAGFRLVEREEPDA